MSIKHTLYLARLTLLIASGAGKKSGKLKELLDQRLPLLLHIAESEKTDIEANANELMLSIVGYQDMGDYRMAATLAERIHRWNNIETVSKNRYLAAAMHAGAFSSAIMAHIEKGMSTHWLNLAREMTGVALLGAFELSGRNKRKAAIMGLRSFITFSESQLNPGSPEANMSAIWDLYQADKLYPGQHLKEYPDTWPGGTEEIIGPGWRELLDMYGEIKMANQTPDQIKARWNKPATLKP